MNRLALFFLYLCISNILLSNPHRPSSYPFIAGDTFRQICNHIVDETNIPFDPQKVKRGDVIFLKTDMCQYFFTKLHPQISEPYILVTHNSDFAPIGQCTVDHPTTQFTAEKYLDDPQILVWFAQNVDRIHPKLKPIPIGIGNQYCSHGNVHIFKKAIQNIPPIEERKNIIYINTSRGINKDRHAAIDYFKNKPFCHTAERKPVASYLEEMKQFTFVLSPPGNGFDCHRTWEALLMGCIPIVKHSILDALFEGLPVILVHEWQKITPEFLDSQYQILQKKILQKDKIYAEYWINLIQRYKNNFKEI